MATAEGLWYQINNCPIKLTQEKHKLTPKSDARQKLNLKPISHTSSDTESWADIESEGEEYYGTDLE